jgi:Eukaryotic DNA topoisomerase I, catalytic core
MYIIPKNISELEIAFLQAIQDRSMAANLSSFGKLARYIFAVGMYNYGVTIKASNLETLDKIVKKCYITMDRAAIFNEGFNADYVRRQLPPEDIQRDYFQDLKKRYKASIENNFKIEPEEKTLFSKGLTLLSKGEDIARSGILSMARIAWAVSDTLGQAFDEMMGSGNSSSNRQGIPVSSDSVSIFYSEWRDAVKAMTGKSGLTSVTTVILNKSNPETVKLYRNARARIKENMDIAIRNLSKDGPIDVNLMANALTKLGFELLTFPTKKDGFVGKIGMSSGKVCLYTEFDEELQSNIAVGSKVVMNPKYDSNKDDSFYCKFMAPNAVGEVRNYTKKRVETNQSDKHDKVEVKTTQIAKWIKVWERDIKNKSPDVNMPAAAALILYLTGARVGSRIVNISKKGAEQTYGVISIRRRHLKLTANKITFEYVGKKGMDQTNTIKVDDIITKRILDILKTLVVGKKPDELVWTYVPKNSASGDEIHMSYSLFVKYCASVGLRGVHSLRNIRGTGLLQDILKAKPFKEPKTIKLKERQKAADDYIISAITEAGKLLGHKSIRLGVETTAWRTTVKSYINPAIIKNFYIENKLQIPKWVPTNSRVAKDK